MIKVKRNIIAYVLLITALLTLFSNFQLRDQVNRQNSAIIYGLEKELNLIVGSLDSIDQIIMETLENKVLSQEDVKNINYELRNVRAKIQNIEAYGFRISRNPEEYSYRAEDMDIPFFQMKDLVNLYLDAGKERVDLNDNELEIIQGMQKYSRNIVSKIEKQEYQAQSAEKVIDNILNLIFLVENE